MREPQGVINPSQTGDSEFAFQDVSVVADCGHYDLPFMTAPGVRPTPGITRSAFNPDTDKVTMRGKLIRGRCMPLFYERAAAHTESEALSLMPLGFQPCRLLLLLAPLVLERGLADGIFFDALDLRIIKAVEDPERQIDGP